MTDAEKAHGEPLPADQADQPDELIVNALNDAGLIAAAGETIFRRLTGGVSSDIWQVQTPARSFCVKRALAKLRVAADWMAPVERNRYEVAWIRIVHDVLPDCVPEVILHDEDAMLCVMDFLEPSVHHLYKSELRDGRVDIAFAAQLGDALVQIHAATANRESLHTVFPRADIFHAIRLEPYLEATAERHPDLREILFDLSARTGATQIAMIHGDVSPKNILVGPKGPVFLDAECACIGDPAFDLAFCLNHFLLKCLWCPSASSDLLAAFDAMATAYLAKVDWEPVGEFETRAATLLPGLALARIDGKSPVEYLTDPGDKDRVRRFARNLLTHPVNHLADVRSAFAKEL